MRLSVVLVLIAGTVGGALGWWLGSPIGVMTAYFASLIGTALGIYLTRRFIRSHLS